MIELLKVSNNNKIILESLIKSLNLWICDREDKRLYTNLSDKEKAICAISHSKKNLKEKGIEAIIFDYISSNE